MDSPELPPDLPSAHARIRELESDLASLDALVRRHAEIYEHKLAVLRAELATVQPTLPLE